MQFKSKPEHQDLNDPASIEASGSAFPALNRSKTTAHPGSMALLIILGLVILFGLPLLYYPFGRDQGIHAYTAASWLDGKLPYRDVWVQKGPLVLC